MLVSHTSFHDGQKFLIRAPYLARGRFKQRLDLPLLLSKQAVSKLAVSRQPQTVATRAKGLRNRRYEPNSADPVRKVEVPRGLRCIGSNLRNQCPELAFYQTAYLRAADDLRKAPRTIRIQGHKLNEPQDYAQLACISDKRQAILQVDISQEQGIDSNVQGALDCRLNSLQNAVQTISSGDLTKRRLAQRIERNIDMR
jgi:hypothetical protein